jgi:hypothetical protein
MLALYRSGRQAEALAAYADARRTLVAELGIEPGPALSRLHDEILRQDPSLDAPEPERPPPARRRRRRAGALLVAGGALLAMAAGAILLTGDEPAEAPAAGTGQLVALDAGTGRIERRIHAGRTPAVVTVHHGDAWAVDTETRTLLRVDRSGETVDVLATGATPVDVAAAGDRIWVANGRRREVAQTLGPVAEELVRLDPATRREEATVPLPAAGTAAEQGSPGHLAASHDALWAITAADRRPHRSGDRAHHRDGAQAACLCDRRRRRGCVGPGVRRQAHSARRADGPRRAPREAPQPRGWRARGRRRRGLGHRLPRRQAVAGRLRTRPGDRGG